MRITFGQKRLFFAQTVELKIVHASLQIAMYTGSYFLGYMFDLILAWWRDPVEFDDSSWSFLVYPI